MRFSVVVIVGLSCLFLTGTNLARANDARGPISLVSNNTEMTSMMAEMEEMQARLGSLEAANLGSGKDLKHSCDCCSDSGWFASAEIAVLQVHTNSGVIFIGSPNGDVQENLSFDYYATPRLNLGFRGPNGLGVRARYWVFDQDADPLQVTGGSRSQTGSLNVRTLDLEATKALYGCGIHWELAAGVRYAKDEVSGAGQLSNVPFPPNAPQGTVDISGDFNLDFEGIGPTFALEGRHRIGATNLSVVGNLRTSLLFGQQQYFASQDISGLVTSSLTVDGEFQDKILPVIESQVGVEWRVPFGCGQFSARAMLEGQWWSSGSGGSDIFTPAAINAQLIPLNDQDLAFFGGSFGIGYNW